MPRKAESAEEAGVHVVFDASLAHPKKRSVTIAGHRTSVTLEEAFWRDLKNAALEEGLSVSALVAAIDAIRETAGLSAAVRVFLLCRRIRLAKS